MGVRLLSMCMLFVQQRVCSRGCACWCMVKLNRLQNKREVDAMQQLVLIFSAMLMLPRTK